MQIVIDIPEDMYEWAKCVNKFRVDFGIGDFINAITNGIPLPKGHGRLIDVNALYEQYAYTGYNFDMTMEYVPTIIEADKGE